MPQALRCKSEAAEIIPQDRGGCDRRGAGQALTINCSEKDTKPVPIEMNWRGNVSQGAAADRRK